MKLAKWGLAILLASPIAMVRAVSAQSQDAAQSGRQQDSLAAAARRARAQKKDEPKAAKVWDNDNIASTPGAVSIVGESGGNAPAEPSDNGAQNQDKAASAKDKAAKSAELDADQQQLKSLKTELDIAQRKLVLDQQMYYGKPDYSSDSAGAAALKDEQDQIDAKQQEIDDLQKKIDELQSQLASAGGDSSSSSPGASSASTGQNQDQNQNENSPPPAPNPN